MRRFYHKVGPQAAILLSSARMGSSLAELIILAAAVWMIARLLEPMRRRLERALLRLLGSSRADIVDAEVLPPPSRRKERP